MLQFDDIQHILLTRAPALTGRYEFLSFHNAAGGREWLAAVLERVQSAAAMRATVEKENRWVSVAFTWNGLRALGVDEASLGTFPEEFKQGMVARAEMLGDTGENHPDRWIGGLASPNLHAIVILFARDETERAGRRRNTQSSSGGARASKCSRRWTWRRRRRLITPTITSAIATGCRNRSSREAATKQPRAPAHRSSPANLYSATRTKRGPPPTCRIRKCSRATAASWPIGVWRSM